MNETNETEPESADGFFAAARALLDKIRSGRDRIAADTAHARAAALRTKMAVGVRARQFVATPFWTEDLLPWLQGECDAALRPWTPGSPDAPFSRYGINAKYFYASGKAAVVGLLLARLKHWVDEGEEAARQLAHEEARDKARA